MKFIRTNWPVLLIVLLAFFLRLVKISYLPPSLNWDEVSHGYNAYSILKTGKDEWGKSFPLIFRAYGDYKLPVYIYLTVITEALFGLSAFAVRLPSVLAGTAAVLLTYLVAQEIFKKKEVSLIAALLVAIEPWTLFTSRIALEANVGFALCLMGIFLLIKGLSNPKLLIYSSLAFGLSVWTYNAQRVFVPLFISAVAVLFIKELKKNYRWFLVLMLFLIPMFLQLANPEGQARYGWVRIIDEGAIGEIISSRQESNLPDPLPRLLHNRPVYFASTFVKNYLSHFSLKYLYTKGGDNYSFSIPDHGVLLAINAPFLLWGTYILFLEKNKYRWLLLSWIFLAPIASSLTKGAPHVLRSMVLLPLPMLLTALGVVDLLQGRGKKIVYFAVLILFTGNYIKTAIDYRSDKSWAWQYGHSEMLSFVKDKYAEYDHIIISKKHGEPHEFILFYWPWDPATLQKDPNLERFYQSNWYWVDRFDKFYFVNDWQMKKSSTETFVTESGLEVNCTGKKCLLINSVDNTASGWRVIKAIKFLDGATAFEIYEN